MNYYIDFDHTLFDTSRFKSGLHEILENNGLDKSLLEINLSKRVSEKKFINIRDLFKILSEENNIPLKNFIEPLEKLYSRCEEFLYDDSIEFLDYLKSKGHKLYLLTWGEKELQKEKTISSKIDKYFDEMYFTEELKYTLDSIDYTKGIFLDDSIRDLEGLYARNPIKVIRIRRENGKNSKEELKTKGILEYSSLRELKKNLENII